MTKFLRVTHIDAGVKLETLEETMANRGSWPKVSFNDGWTLNYHMDPNGTICFTDAKSILPVISPVRAATLLTYLIEGNSVKTSRWRSQKPRERKSREYWEAKHGTQQQAEQEKEIA